MGTDSSGRRGRTGVLIGRRWPRHRLLSTLAIAGVLLRSAGRGRRARGADGAAQPALRPPQRRSDRCERLFGPARGVLSEPWRREVKDWRAGHRPSRHGRLLRQRRAAAAAGAAGEAGDRLRLGAAGGGDDGELRGAEAGRDPLGDAGGDGAAAAAGRDLHPARLPCLPRGLGAGDGGAALERRDGRGGRARRGVSGPDRAVLAEGDDAADRGRDPSRSPAASPARSGSPRAGCWPRSPASSASRPASSSSRARTALERFADHSPGLVPGIGPKTVLRLEKLGVTTLAELRRDGRARSSKSASGRARAPGSTPAPGSGTRPRSRPRARPNRSRPRPPSTSTSPTAASWSATSPSSPRSSAGGCASATSRGRSIGIKVRLDDWTNVSRSHSVDEPTNDPEVVRPVALDLLRAYDPPRPVRLLGVRLASFEGEADGADAEAAGADAGEAEPQLRLSLPG